ncbi:hypothetical protein M951_chr3159 (nucleomorph) [Lotharella oceanica]|uniref:Uncharacterized protein n=1 Tax=Lotharella oceanica TaxID=641309 RepID=A0A060DFA4_9EUKA|nr:hypothetical protein M951_chr146 [Lotharella oceanica]AIB09664.1 hypothetical protein M951_chr1185 [Lotharella oceanica]AIB09749.1 hypothetical protein M951_chr246 [Lotharella oceanica]AIB09867.1 hypothetical protein M951_chr2175 [Lotharella oceanica]AIB09952.1 hypothetical protein M951_chr346 [Lotharella oceanica]
MTVRAPCKDGNYLMPCIEVTYNGNAMGMDLLKFGKDHYEERSVRSRSLTPPLQGIECPYHEKTAWCCPTLRSLNEQMRQTKSSWTKTPWTYRLSLT